MTYKIGLKGRVLYMAAYGHGQVRTFQTSKNKHPIQLVSAHIHRYRGDECQPAALVEGDSPIHWGESLSAYTWDPTTIMTHQPKIMMFMNSILLP